MLLAYSCLSVLSWLWNVVIDELAVWLVLRHRPTTLCEIDRYKWRNFKQFKVNWRQLKISYLNSVTVSNCSYSVVSIGNDVADYKMKLYERGVIQAYLLCQDNRQILVLDHCLTTPKAGVGHVRLIKNNGIQDSF